MSKKRYYPTNNEKESICKFYGFKNINTPEAKDIFRKWPKLFEHYKIGTTGSEARIELLLTLLDEIDPDFFEKLQITASFKNIGRPTTRWGEFGYILVYGEIKSRMQNGHSEKEALEEYEKHLKTRKEDQWDFMLIEDSEDLYSTLEAAYKEGRKSLKGMSFNSNGEEIETPSGPIDKERLLKSSRKALLRRYEGRATNEEIETMLTKIIEKLLSREKPSEF